MFNFDFYKDMALLKLAQELDLANNSNEPNQHIVLYKLKISDYHHNK